MGEVSGWSRLVAAPAAPLGNSAAQEAADAPSVIKGNNSCSSKASQPPLEHSEGASICSTDLPVDLAPCQAGIQTFFHFITGYFFFCVLWESYIHKYPVCG